MDEDQPAQVMGIAQAVVAVRVLKVLMTTITLSLQLVAELEQIASEQAVKPEDLLEDTIRTYVRGLE